MKILQNKKWIYFHINNKIEDTIVLESQISLLEESVQEIYNQLVELAEDKKSHSEVNNQEVITAILCDIKIMLMKIENGLFEVLCFNGIKVIAVGVFNNNHFYIRTTKAEEEIPDLAELKDVFMFVGLLFSNSNVMNTLKVNDEFECETDEDILSYVDDIITTFDEFNYDDLRKKLEKDGNLECFVKQV